MPDIGETVTAVPMEEVASDDRAGEIGEVMQVHADGTVTIDVSAAAPAFYADCAPTVALDTLKRLGPQSSASFMQPLRRAAWREIPSTYVVCTEDRVIAVPGGEAVGESLLFSWARRVSSRLKTRQPSASVS